MYQGYKAELEMKRMILVNKIADGKVFLCKIFKYDTEKESIYLLLEDDELTDVSLDAVYECRIKGREVEIISEGRITERYYNEAGKTLVYQIENGFYKNSIKSVDKQEV